MIRARISLNTEVTFFLTLSAVLLSSVFFVDQWAGGKQGIRREAERGLSHLSRRLPVILEEICSGYVIDLEGLASQLKRCAVDDEAEMERRFTAFARQHAGIFQLIGFDPHPSGRCWRIRAVRVLDGDVEARVERFKSSVGQHTPADRCRLTASGDALYLSCPVESLGTLWVQVPVLRWFETALSALSLPPELSVMAADSGGFIRYHPDAGQHKRSLDAYFGPGFSEMHWREGAGCQPPSGAVICMRENMAALPLQLYFSYDQAPALKALKARMQRTTVVALGIFIFSLVIARLMVGRFSTTLNEITRVATHVAEGDFTQSLAVARSDEIGLLIDGFNAMVDRLGESYAVLHETNAALAKQYEELLATRAELSEKERLALIGETVSKISHEIQNRIGGVSIWVQNLDAAVGEDALIRPYVQEIDDALSRFMDLLSRFKQFYRLPDFTFSTVDLRYLLEQVVHSYGPEVADQGVRLRLDLPPEAVLMNVDAPQLSEAVANLIRNAVYYSPAGGTVILTLFTGEEQSIIAVSDQGPGIDPDMLPSLFRPFFTTKSSGSGLGLAMVKRIAQAHGGSARAETQPEGGARFEICLPVTLSQRRS